MKLTKARRMAQWKSISRLYHTAFPRYERKPFWMILLMSLAGKTDVWVLEKDGEYSGFAATMGTGDMVLLDYFAVAPEQRSRGLGSEALRLLQEHYRDRRFFLEIESVYEDADNLPERQRRKRFYLANGMSELHIMADLFGTKMELLGYQCSLSYAEYRSLYVACLGKWTAKHVEELPYPD